jgi:hypothetical protein
MPRFCDSSLASRTADVKRASDEVSTEVKWQIAGIELIHFWFDRETKPRCRCELPRRCALSEKINQKLIC